MSGLETAFAVFTVLYGILKIAVGIAVFVVPICIIRRSKILSAVLGVDETVSGKGIEVAISAYGLYSLMHGLAFFGIGLAVTAIALTRTAQLAVHIALGTALVLFYILVLFTNAPISKDEHHRTRYMIMGLVSGLTFLLGAVILRMRHLFIDASGDMSALANDPEIWVWTACSAALVAVSADIVIDALKQKGNRDTIVSDMTTLIMIPSL